VKKITKIDPRLLK